MSAEQLAPILSPGNPRGDESRVDESFVLPILTALDGAPEVRPMTVVRFRRCRVLRKQKKGVGLG